MSCFERVDIHPQDPAQWAALARASSHADRCAACSARLRDLRAADEALSGGLLGLTSADPCPEPEELAAWIDDGLAVGATLTHASTCADCRADVLEALAEPAARGAAPAAGPRAALPFRRLVEVAAAAVVLAAVGWALIPSGASPGVAEITPTRPAPPAPTTGPAPAPIKIERPADEPEPELGPEPEFVLPLPETPAAPPRPEPAPQGQGAPAEPEAPPAPAAEAPTGPEEAPTEAEAPADAPADPADPAGAPTEPDAPAEAPVVVAALDVGASSNLFVQSAGGTWVAFESGQVPTGSSLRSGADGARFRVAQGVLYVDPKARLGWDGSLSVETGQVVVEGKGLELQAAEATVTVNGRVLVEVRGGKVGVQVLAGGAEFSRDDDAHTLETGGVLTASRSKVRVGRAASGAHPQELPPWAKRMRKKGPRPPRRGRPGPRFDSTSGDTPSSTPSSSSLEGSAP